MTTAPPEKRPRSKPTRSAGIPGGNKSRRWVCVGLPGVCLEGGVEVMGLNVRGGGKGQMCGVFGAWGHGVDIKTELGEEGSPEPKEEPPGHGVC